MPSRLRVPFFLEERLRACRVRSPAFCGSSLSLGTPLFLSPAYFTDKHNTHKHIQRLSSCAELLSPPPALLFPSCGSFLSTL